MYLLNDVHTLFDVMHTPLKDNLPGVSEIITVRNNVRAIIFTTALFVGILNPMKMQSNLYE